jgi:hypothetical protein
VDRRICLWDEYASGMHSTVPHCLLSHGRFYLRSQGFKKGLEAMQCYSLEQIQQNRAHFLSQLAKVSYGQCPRPCIQVFL